MDYDFLICGLRLRAEVPWVLKETAGTAPFLLPPGTPGQPDLTACFQEVDRLELPETGGVWYEDSYYLSAEGKSRVWHRPAPGEPPYCRVVWDEEFPDIVSCRYVKGSGHRIAYTRNLLSLLGLEMLLLRFGAFILHAALVDWQGRGIVFCAPSGTGNSTQADLWDRHMGSRTLNGDRAGIRCDRGVWKAWGLPYAGTSGIYRNASVPIRALVLLRQGEENCICRVDPLDAFKRMLPECSAQRWDIGFMDRLMGDLSALVSAVPVYGLTCRPDIGAVELLCDQIMKEDGNGDDTDPCGTADHGISP